MRAMGLLWLSAMTDKQTPKPNNHTKTNTKVQFIDLKMLKKQFSIGSWQQQKWIRANKNDERTSSLTSFFCMTLNKNTTCTWPQNNTDGQIEKQMNKQKFQLIFTFIYAQILTNTNIYNYIVQTYINTNTKTS